MSNFFPLALLALAPFVAHAESVLRPEDIPADYIRQGYGRPGKNRTVDGAPLVIAGEKFTHGLGTHAPGRIELALDGGKASFSAKVGLPDAVKGTEARVEFIVEGDGKTLWRSGPMTPGDAAKPVALDLAGVKRLALVVTDGGNGNTSDHAVWADARVVAEGSAPRPADFIASVPFGAAKLSFRIRDGAPHLALDAPSGKALLRGPAYPGPTDLRYLHPAVSILHADGSDALSIVYASHEILKPDADTTEVILRLRDKARPVEVAVHYLLRADCGVMETWSEVRNGDAKPVKVRDALSGYLPLARPADASAVMHINKWGNEMERVGARPQHANFTGENWSACRHLVGSQPAFTLNLDKKPLTEESGTCLLGALVWSGANKVVLEQSADNTDTRLLVGVRGEDAVHTLDAGATLTTPRLLVTLSEDGLGAASRNLHRWARTHGGLREPARDRYIDNNSWEGAAFRIDEKSVAGMIEDSAKLGVELYVLDDGWFGLGDDARVNANAGLGDWVVNTAKFPDLGKLVDLAGDRGMKFGIWVEPEMVNERSALFREHPEWALRYPDREPRRIRDQLVLDMANPAVRDFVFKAVDDILVKYPKIAYIKWDCNSDTPAPHSNFLPADRQGDLPRKFMEGYYEVMDRLVKKHPAVFFQACASGGGRADYGALKYSHTFWPSDNTSPGYRLKGAWDFSTYYPVEAITSHVTHSGSGYSPKYRVDISFFGQFGLEIDPRRLAPDYRAAVVAGIADYKKVREVIQHGEQYRTLSPYDGPVAAVNYVSPDRSRAVLLGYRDGEKTETVATLPLRGLDPAKTYVVREMNLPEGERPRLVAGPASLTGAELMKSGLRATFRDATDSVAVEMTSR